MRLFKNNKAQSTAEYAILIGLVVGVLVVMQTYMKRGIQGRFRDVTDNFGAEVGGNTDWENAGGDKRVVYDPKKGDYPQWEFNKYSATRTRETKAGTTTTEKLDTGGKATRDITEVTQQAEQDNQKYDYKLGE